MKPAIQWWSNHPHAPTGYGTQTKAVVDRLAAEGFPVSISANYGQQAVVSDYVTGDGHTVPVFPQGYDGYSQDIIFGHYHEWKRLNDGGPTVLVTLFDAWVLKNPRLEQVDAIVSWMPIDHMPIPVEVLKWAQRGNVAPVAMSQYGLAQFEKQGVEATYIPHTIEPVFRRTTGWRDILDVPDGAYVVMMNAANKGTAPTRKSWSENLMALSVFMDKHDDVFVYIHTEAQCPAGIDLMALANAIGMDKKRVIWPNQYEYRIGGYTDDDLAKMYSRADVFLAVSMGEGFGIPTIEAQACGTRVIGSNWTATPELLSDDSFLVTGQPEWDPAQLSFWFRPHIASIVEALEQSYEAGGGLSRQAMEKAADYQAAKVIPRWFDLLQAVV
jgi:hypothetical protein